jgi:hypothetical protein
VLAAKAKETPWADVDALKTTLANAPADRLDVNSQHVCDFLGGEKPVGV